MAHQPRKTRFVKWVKRQSSRPGTKMELFQKYIRRRDAEMLPGSAPPECLHTVKCFENYFYCVKHNLNKDDLMLGTAESPGAVVLHVGTNDTGLRQSEILKKDFRSLIETVRRTSPATQIIVSGPLPTYRRGNERFSRLLALNEWLITWCKEQKLLFANNWNLFWERPRLFRPDGLHPSRAGAELLSDNISRLLRTI
ncbi:GDSL lipase Rv0518-like isoform X4 [Danio rerio]|uniref:GDSL lipase Rv0518-like isoform X4 n=1 Tax=Danio rerio TaxID=7955 RepID=A0AC58JF15_DANRE